MTQAHSEQTCLNRSVIWKQNLNLDMTINLSMSFTPPVGGAASLTLGQKTITYFPTETRCHSFSLLLKEQTNTHTADDSQLCMSSVSAWSASGLLCTSPCWPSGHWSVPRSQCLCSSPGNHHTGTRPARQRHSAACVTVVRIKSLGQSLNGNKEKPLTCRFSLKKHKMFLTFWVFKKCFRSFESDWSGQQLTS